MGDEATRAILPGIGTATDEDFAAEFLGPTMSVATVTDLDAAAVVVNASTRFVDGGELGLGAEIGISTQKLHARGPMGLAALTSTRFVVTGTGQVRT